METRFSLTVQTSREAHTPSCTVRTGFLLQR